MDGAENNETALTLARHGEVAKYFSRDEHTMIPDVLVIGQKSWDKLTPEQQQALKKAADDSMMYHKDLWQKMIAETTQEAKDKLGVTFVEVDKNRLLMQQRICMMLLNQILYLRNILNVLIV